MTVALKKKSLPGKDFRLFLYFKSVLIFLFKINIFLIFAYYFNILISKIIFLK